MTKFKRRERPGAPTTHAAFSEVKKYREVPFDMRKKDDRALMLWQKEVVKDLGGVENLDMLQSSCLDRAVELLIILRSMSLYVGKEGIMADDGNVAPCLKTSFIAYQNSFRRTLEIIYSRKGLRPPKMKSLSDIIEAGDENE